MKYPCSNSRSPAARVVQQLHDAVVGRLAPLDPADGAVAPDDGQLQGGVAGPQEDLPRAAELPELGEHEPDGTLDPLVRIELDSPFASGLELQRRLEQRFALREALVGSTRPALVAMLAMLQLELPGSTRGLCCILDRTSRPRRRR